MKTKIILLLLLMSTNMSAQWTLFGETFQIKLGIPYEYYAALAVGGLSRASCYTWKVVNGKIRDQNGNYTLTTLEKESAYDPIFIIWDCVEMGKKAEIGLIGNRLRLYTIISMFTSLNTFTFPFIRV